MDIIVKLLSFFIVDDRLTLNELVHRSVKLSPYKLLEFLLVLNFLTVQLDFGHPETRNFDFFKLFEIFC